MQVENDKDNEGNPLEEKNEESKVWKIIDKIDFKLLIIVFFFSCFFWAIASFLYNGFVYNRLEIEDTAAKFYTELKIVGVPEPLKLVEYDFEKGVRRRSNSKVHLTFNFDLSKEDVLHYYEKNLLDNDWCMVSEENNKWIYEKGDYQIKISYLLDKRWKLDMQYKEEGKVF